MVFKRYMVRISLRLGLIFLAMLALAFLIGENARFFSILAVLLILLLLISELFYTLSRTNRVITSLLESIRFGDYNRKIGDRAADLGFGHLADSAQEIISAIAAARIEKETQFQYLQTILEHIHTGVLTLNKEMEPELINPIALNVLGLYHTRLPSWKEMEKASPYFTAHILKMGERGREMIRLSSTPAGKQLLILVNTMKIGGEPIRIITFQDIEPEIEQKEMESWQTISRIMAHEIMNSLTPLASLTETGIMMLEENHHPRDISRISQQTIDNLHMALKTIADRNAALTKFIGNYRQLSRLPMPERKELHISGLLEEIKELHHHQCRERGISCTIHPGPAQLSALADESQVKQVLINLVKNAMEAVEGDGDGRMEIRTKRILDEVSIEISDNGSGIPQDILEKIFVPFYTTKPEGSGIGLSLSRQIIRNHGGQISVESEPGSGTTFKITLPVNEPR